MVTSVVMTSLIIRRLAQNYAKKCKNGTISKIEIVRVRKKIFYFSFQFLKAKQEYIMVNILVWTKRWPGAVKLDILEKSFSKCAKFTNDRIARLNRYIIRTNHPFHLKFCTVAPFFEFCTSLCHDINNLFKFMRKICKNSTRHYM